MKQAVLLSLLGLLINLGCFLCSDIYPSINWVPQNPLFLADGKSCLSEYRTLKVRLQSKVNFICPNTATVLQKTVVGVQTANMYENLWIVYNKTAFDACDTTLKGQLKTSRLLLHCNTPTKLSYFPVLFAQFTAEPNGLRFEGGRKYYFLGTSDGTESHINDTNGGHCNDTQNGIFMKIEVYVCLKSNQTYTDPECKEKVGVLECPKSPISTQTTTQTIAPTTASSAVPPTAPATTTPTQTVSPSTKPEPSTKEEISTQTSFSDETKATTTAGKLCPVGPNNPQAQIGDNKMKKELETWRVTTITLTCILICIALVAAVVLVYHKCSKKDKIGHQSIDPEISKSPAERQVSVGGVSNRGFINSIIIKGGGEDEKRKSDSPSPIFYNVANVDDIVNENPAVRSKEIDTGNSTLGIYGNALWNTSAPDGNVVIQNNAKCVLYGKGEKSKENSPA